MAAPTLSSALDLCSHAAVTVGKNEATFVDLEGASFKMDTEHFCQLIYGLGVVMREAANDVVAFYGYISKDCCVEIRGGPRQSQCGALYSFSIKGQRKEDRVEICKAGIFRLASSCERIYAAMIPVGEDELPDINRRAKAVFRQYVEKWVGSRDMRSASPRIIFFALQKHSDAESEYAESALYLYYDNNHFFFLPFLKRALLMLLVQYEAECVLFEWRGGNVSRVSRPSLCPRVFGEEDDDDGGFLSLAHQFFKSEPAVRKSWNI